MLKRRNRLNNWRQDLALATIGVLLFVIGVLAPEPLKGTGIVAGIILLSLVGAW
jgi:hypothetical protein